jgi:nucleoside-diphosphate-sugar epimerase
VRPFELYLPVPLMAAAGFLADRWQRLTGRARPFGSDKVIEARQPGWWMDDEKAARLLGFVGKIALDEGVREAIPWYAERRLL